MKKMYIAVSRINGRKYHRVKEFVEAFYCSGYKEAEVIWIGEYKTIDSVYETLRVSARRTHLNVKVHLVDDVIYFDR